jgi:hypothetical protein
MKWREYNPCTLCGEELELFYVDRISKLTQIRTYACLCENTKTKEVLFKK